MGVLTRWLESRRGRRHQHRESCPDCVLRQRRQRQYLERLRDAEIPRASDDLTARLLARTPQLASEQPAGPPGTPHRAAHSALRVAMLAAGGTVALAGLMAGSAYLMGAEAPPVMAGAATSAFTDQHLPVRDAAGGTAGSGWNLPGAAALTPAGALTAAQLNGLRAQGWTCPELRELGYHLVWARAGAAAGGDLLELRLTDGRHFATILEQHGAASMPPVNVLTGHPAAADGFTAATFQSLGLPAAAPGAPSSAADAGWMNTVWINADAPFRAIYQTPAATFTYVSDQSAEQADDGLAALVRSRAGTPGHGAVRGTGGDADIVTARMERGLGRILELLAP